MRIGSCVGGVSAAVRSGIGVSDNIRLRTEDRAEGVECASRLSVLGKGGSGKTISAEVISQLALSDP
jgi:hypothetical protein